MPHKSPLKIQRPEIEKDIKEEFKWTISLDLFTIVRAYSLAMLLILGQLTLWLHYHKLLDDSKQSLWREDRKDTVTGLISSRQKDTR